MGLKKWIVVEGNPVDGFKFTGPYEEFDDAECALSGTNESAWVAELEDPE